MFFELAVENLFTEILEKSEGTSDVPDVAAELVELDAKSGDVDFEEKVFNPFGVK